MEKVVTTEKRGDSLIVVFKRPHIRSPLSIVVLDRLDAILSEACDENTKTIIFTGTGDVFASGADLREIAALNGSTARAFAERGQNLMNKIAVSRAETVAAVNGFCFGGALDLALACDRRVAAPNAVFSHPGANLGIVTGWGGTQRLPRLIGEAAALEVFLTAQRLDAREAKRIGLIDQIAENPLEFAMANYAAKSSS